LVSEADTKQDKGVSSLSAKLVNGFAAVSSSMKRGLSGLSKSFLPQPDDMDGDGGDSAAVSGGYDAGSSAVAGVSVGHAPAAAGSLLVAEHARSDKLEEQGTGTGAGTGTFSAKDDDDDNMSISSQSSKESPHRAGYRAFVDHKAREKESANAAPPPMMTLLRSVSKTWKSSFRGDAVVSSSHNHQEGGDFGRPSVPHFRREKSFTGKRLEKRQPRMNVWGERAAEAGAAVEAAAEEEEEEEKTVSVTVKMKDADASARLQFFP